MITDKFLNEMPSKNITKITTLDNEQNNEINSIYNMSTNNDLLVKIDPDHNIFQNSGVKQYCNYDTSVEFNKTFCSISNMSILHLNICSSQHKLTDLSYFFSFIGISETLATKFNNHILNIPTYHHEQCLRSNNKKGGGTSLYKNKDIQYKNRNDLSFPKQHYDQYLLK